MVNTEKLKQFAAVFADSSIGTHVCFAAAMCEAFAKTAPFQVGGRIILKKFWEWSCSPGGGFRPGSKGTVDRVDWTPEKGWRYAVVMDDDREKSSRCWLTPDMAREWDPR